jgi:signal peptidase I
VVAADHEPARLLSLEEGGPPADEGAPRRRAGLRVVLAVVVLLVVARLLVVEPFAIPSGSMEPTLMPGEHVLADKLSYRLGGPHRGDLVVFRAPRSDDVLLKRVVALPGQRVGIEDAVLVVDGRRPREPYVTDRRLIDGEYFGPITVPAGAVFVLGDRRSDSIDSRDFGAVPESRLIGRVDARVWPLDRLHVFR